MSVKTRIEKLEKIEPEKPNTELDARCMEEFNQNIAKVYGGEPDPNFPKTQKEFDAMVERLIEKVYGPQTGDCENPK